MSLTGKVAIVTGGGSGIGAATARRLADDGAKVVVVDWNVEAAERVVAALAGERESIAVRADVSVERDVERYMQAAQETFGRIDLLHLNAGIAGQFEPFPEVGTEQFDRVIAVNLRSVFLGLRAALKYVRPQGTGGAIVATSSLAGLHGGETLVPYTAAKHGVIGLVKTASSYGARIGVPNAVRRAQHKRAPFCARGSVAANLAPCPRPRQPMSAAVFVGGRRHLHWGEPRLTAAVGSPHTALS
jgi:NAD(P)-dependent dehydrogenase (short-subunit alcohol dehydrogenase family)